MNLEARIHRHGYHLMSLASAGMVCITLLGVIVTAMPWMQGWNPQAAVWSISGVTWAEAIAMTPDARTLLSLSGAVWTLSCLLPLLALRRLGHCLYRHAALSRPVAAGFRWLAHSLPLMALGGISAKLLAGIAVERTGSLTGYRLEMDFGDAYLFLIACLCLYSVAHLMRLAADAADDARSIV